MKTIIAIRAAGNKGKTQSIVAAAKRFPMIKTEYFDYYTGECIAEPDKGLILCKGIYEKDGAKKYVAFSSEGNYKELVTKAFDIITGKGSIMPEVMVAACRTKGGSVDAINEFASVHGYRIVWASPYISADPQNISALDVAYVENLNNLFAINLISLITILL